MNSESLDERYYQYTLQSIWALERHFSKATAPPSYHDRDKLLGTGVRICQMMRAALKTERRASNAASDFDLFQLCLTYEKHLQNLERDSGFCSSG